MAIDGASRLVLSRKVGEVILIGPDITVEVVEIDRGNVRLRVTAPETTAIYREEIAPADMTKRRGAV